MAKFKNSNIELKDNQEILLGNSQDSSIKFDGNDLLLESSAVMYLGPKTGTNVQIHQAGDIVAFEANNITVGQFREGYQYLGLNGDTYIFVDHTPTKLITMRAGNVQGFALSETYQRLGVTADTLVEVLPGNNTINMYAGGDKIYFSSNTSQRLGFQNTNEIYINKTNYMKFFFGGTERLALATNGIDIHENIYIQHNLNPPNSAAMYRKMSDGGKTYFQANNIAGTNKFLWQGDPDGRFEIYDTGVMVFETDTTGVSILGDLQVDDDVNVDGRERVVGHMAIGAEATFDYPGFPTYEAIVKIDEEFNLTGGGSGIVLNVDNAAVNAGATLYGIQCTAQNDLSTLHSTIIGGTFFGNATKDGVTVTDIKGAVAQSACPANNATITNLIGLEANVVTGFGSPGQTFTNMIAGKFEVLKYGSGSPDITNAYGVLIKDPGYNPSGVNTNLYGLYIEDQSVSSFTNEYNIFSAGANSKNHFEGDVTIEGTLDAGLNTSMIFQDDSYVKVVDDGTAAGYIEIVADGDQVAYFDAEAASIRLGKTSGAANILVSDTDLSINIDGNEFVNIAESFSYYGKSGETRLYLSPTSGALSVAGVNLVTINSNITTLGVGATNSIRIWQDGTGLTGYVGGANIFSMTQTNQRIGTGTDSRIYIDQSGDSIDFYSGSTKTLDLAVSVQQLGVSGDTNIQLNQSSDQVAAICGGTTTMNCQLNTQVFGVSNNNRISIVQSTDVMEFYRNNAKELELQQSGIIVNEAFSIQQSGSVSQLLNLTHGGDFQIKSENLAGTPTMLFDAIPDGAANLYYDGDIKLATDSTGIIVTGDVHADAFIGDGSGLTGLVPDNLYYLGDKRVESISAGIKISDGTYDVSHFMTFSGEYRIFNNTDNKQIDLYGKNGASASKLLFSAKHDAVITYIDGVNRIYAYSAGVFFYGGLYTFVGDDGQLTIDHSGGDATFENTNHGGLITLMGQNTSGDDKTFIECDSDAGVKHYYDNDIKLATDSTGIVVYGSMRLDEGEWRDINLAGPVLSGGASSVPDLVSFVDENGSDTGIVTYGFAVGEKAHAGFEMQHDYQEGTDVYFHVHFQGNSAPTGTDYVKFEITYTIARTNETLDPVSQIDTGDITYDTQYEMVSHEFGVIDGQTGGPGGGPLQIGDQIIFTMERIAAAGDAYSGDALIMTVGLHYQANSLGSSSKISK